MSDEDRLRISEWILTWDLSSEHRTGTAGDNSTSQWLLEEIAKLGVEPRIEEFPFKRRIPTNCSVEGSTFSVAGVPLFDCAATHSTGTAGDLSYEPTPGSLFVLECGPGESRELHDIRTSNAVGGIVIVSKGLVPGLSLINADSFSSPFGPAALQISTADGRALVAATESNARAKLTVQFSSEKTLATNVLATIRGTSKDLAPVVVMTPKSAWWTCTAERVGGLVIWLECMRHFAVHPPKRTVIFTANTGHELGHLGLEHFLERHPQLASNAHVWVHFGANFAAIDSHIRLQGSDQNLIRQATDQLARVNETDYSVVSPGTRPGGEARNIFDRGGRYISMLGSNRLFHHPQDRMTNNVDLRRLVRLSNACVTVVSQLAHA